MKKIIFLSLILLFKQNEVNSISPKAWNAVALLAGTLSIASFWSTVDIMNSPTNEKESNVNSPKTDQNGEQLDKINSKQDKIQSDIQKGTTVTIVFGLLSAISYYKANNF